LSNDVRNVRSKKGKNIIVLRHCMDILFCGIRKIMVYTRLCCNLQCRRRTCLRSTASNWKGADFCKLALTFWDMPLKVGKCGRPKNIKAVQSFLGLTGFFRKFVPGYALIARPLKIFFEKRCTFLHWWTLSHTAIKRRLRHSRTANLHKRCRDRTTQWLFKGWIWSCVAADGGRQFSSGLLLEQEDFRSRMKAT